MLLLLDEPLEEGQKFERKAEKVAPFTSLAVNSISRIIYKISFFTVKRWSAREAGTSLSLAIYRCVSEDL